MNASDSSSSFITRRDFMKKSALTVGAITLLSQGIGLAAGSESSGFWDMKCAAPEEGMGRVARLATIAIPFSADLELIVVTNKVADPPEAGGYNSISVQHDFSLNLTSGGAFHFTAGCDAFEVLCDRDSGVITSTFEASSSNPTSGTTLASNCVVGTYSVNLTVYITHIQGVEDVTTKVFGVVDWIQIGTPSNSGSYRIPQSESSFIEITNTFEASHH